VPNNKAYIFSSLFLGSTLAAKKLHRLQLVIKHPASGLAEWDIGSLQIQTWAVAQEKIQGGESISVVSDTNAHTSIDTSTTICRIKFY